MHHRKNNYDKIYNLLIFIPILSYAIGFYFNENSAAFDGHNTRTPFSPEQAYEHFQQLNNISISWEQRRVEVMKQRGIMQ